MNKNCRNNDFRRRCLEVYGEMERMGRRPTLREVVVKAIATPAPSFYVSSEYAYNKLLRILHCGELPDPSTPRGCMWMEIAALVQSEQLRRGGSMARALGHVLNFRRPSCFYISTREGMRIASPAFERRRIHRPRRPQEARQSK